MDQTAEPDDGLSWLPGPALRFHAGEVVGANAPARSLLGPPELLLAGLSEADRALLLQVAGDLEQGGAAAPATVNVRIDAHPPHRFVEFRFGAHPGGGTIALAHEVTERERLDAVLAELASGVYITDGELRATWIPHRVSEAAGLSPHQFVGTDVYGLLHPEDVEPVRQLVAQARDMPGVRCSRPMRVHQLGQPDVWWPIVAHLVWRGDDQAIGGLLVRFDMNLTGGVEQHDAEETSQALVTLGSSSTTGALHLDLSGALLQRSTRVLEILRPLGEDGDLRWLDLLRAEDRDAITERLDAARRGVLLPAVEVAFVDDGAVVWARVDALPYRDTQGNVAGMFVNVLDLTSERGARDALAVAREELWHLANHDALTGLANRYQLTDRLAAALAGVDEHIAEAPTRPAVIIGDLDRFKEVNDRHGHRIGDGVLVEAARRIASAVRVGDLVCRFGGDEFVVLCEGVTGLQELQARANRVLEQFTEPFVADDLTFDIGISVGGAMAEPGDAEDPDSLILRADRAMYAAKAERRRPAVGA